MKKLLCVCLTVAMLISVIPLAMTPSAVAETAAANGTEADPALLEKGEDLLNQNLFDETLALWEAAVKAAPNVAAYQAALAEVLEYFTPARTRDAFKAWAEAIRLDPSNWEYRYQRGQLYSAENQDEQAFQDYLAAIALGPTNDEAYYSLSWIYMDRYQLDEAVQTCLAGIEAFPEGYTLWSLLGKIHFMRHDDQAALTAFENAIALGSRWVEGFDEYRIIKQSIPMGDSAGHVDSAIVEQGRALMDAGEYEQATALYEAAIQTAPKAAVYYGDRGEALIGLGDLYKALTMLDIAIELDAKSWEYFNSRGVAFYYLDSIEDALKDLEKAVDLVPNNYLPYFNLAYIQFEAGLTFDAVMTCAFGINAFPEADDLWCLLGDVQFAQGHYKEALEAYDKAIAWGYYTPENIENYQETLTKAK